MGVYERHKRKPRMGLAAVPFHDRRAVGWDLFQNGAGMRRPQAGGKGGYHEGDYYALCARDFDSLRSSKFRSDEGL